jgi:pimeloyl-ACP methyl ester carboxylesterase
MPIMQAQSTQLNGIEMYYEMEGSGEPLLLLHGGTGCHDDWVYAGRDRLVTEYMLIKPDARGHGRSTNPQGTITHRQCALDALALLDHLGIAKCRAIGLSFGANTLLHMATMQPDRIEAMVLVSATMYFPEQARAVMCQVATPDQQPAKEWETMRKRHHLGNEQIAALWNWARGMKDSYDDMNFTPSYLSRITASIDRLRRPRFPLSGRDGSRDVPRDSAVCPLGRTQWKPWTRLSRCRIAVCANNACFFSQLGRAVGRAS